MKIVAMGLAAQVPESLILPSAVSAVSLECPN